MDDYSMLEILLKLHLDFKNSFADTLTKYAIRFNDVEI